MKTQTLMKVGSVNVIVNTVFFYHSAHEKHSTHGKNVGVQIVYLH